MTPLSMLRADMFKDFKKVIADVFSNDKGLRRLFVLIFAVGGLLFVVLIPPFQNPDEPMHFYRSYQLARLNVLSDPDANNIYGGEVPTAMQSLVIESGISHNFDYSYKFDINYKLVTRHHYGGAEGFEGFPNTAIYSPIAYLPSTIAHIISITFDLPLIFALYLARLFSLITVLVAFYLAIRYIPLGKWIIFAVGLIPMTVAAASAVSADAMTISISILFITAALHISLRKGDVSYRWLAALALLSAMIGLIKQAHIALLPLLLLIPLVNRSYQRRKVYIILTIAAAISLSLFVVWYMLVDKIPINFEPTVLPELQRNYVLQHPLGFVRTLLSTYLTDYGSGVFIGMFGNFGWLTATLPTLFMIISALTLFLSIKAKEAKEINIKRIGKKQLTLIRAMCLGVFAATILLVSFALYIYWTPYKQGYIIGIQGRYLLPILPLFLIPFIRVYDTRQAGLKRAITLASIAVLTSAIITIYSRFYA